MRQLKMLSKNANDEELPDLKVGLWPRKIQQHYVRALLYSFEDDFMTIRRDVKVANVKFGRETGELPLDPCVQVDQPEVLVLNLSAEDYECVPSGQESQMSSASSEGQRSQRMRCGLGRDCFY